MKDKKEYLFSADVVRVVAITGVVIVHTANAVYARPDFFGGLSWWIAIVLNSLSRISIPLFIMISGYFILNKHENVKSSLRRAVNRILIPLFVWFLIYIIWSSGEPTLQNINISLIARFLTVNVFDLYFLVILLGLYVVAPFLRNYLANKKYSEEKTITFFFLLLGLCFLQHNIFSPSVLLQ